MGGGGIDPHKRTFTVALAWLGEVGFDLVRVGVEGSAWLGNQVARS